ncbi:MAG: inorganic phosphate transporter [Candidatus Marinimicrobia bacterium]|nr:inorganic phosphate transporter [Candidatus Neomarinimicrobiota bacterium]
MILIYLSSGLFLGWSLGANDASNIFGTAVGTRMVKFRTAALIASVFVILGAVLSGSGATRTLGKLGSVNALGGAFMVALAAGFSVFWMTRLKLPVSTSQAIVGAIVGWNFFAGMLTDYSSLAKIVFSWVLSPVLAAIFAILIYLLVKKLLRLFPISLLRLDVYTRAALIIVGAFGAYSLGANNIANVMGVFVPAAPLDTITIFGIKFTSIQQLFFIGSVAIASGIFTYSYKVMQTVGNKVVKLTPLSALVIVLAESLVLFLFASEGLHDWLIAHNLPALPLVPVSSSQLVVGGVIGIGIIQGGKTIKYRIVGKITSGWVITPLISAIIAFISLFFLKNVFEIKVYEPVAYQFSKPAIKRLSNQNIDKDKLALNQRFENALSLKKYIHQTNYLADSSLDEIVKFTRLDSFYFSAQKLNIFNQEAADWFSTPEIKTINNLQGEEFVHEWRLKQRLRKILDDSKRKGENYRKLAKKIDFVVETFRTAE